MKISKKNLLTMPFAKRLETLEEIYHHIQQSEDKDIENIISLYESGLSLAKSLENDIQSYELKIQEIQSPKYDPNTSTDTSTDKDKVKNDTELQPKTSNKLKKNKLPSENIALFDE